MGVDCKVTLPASARLRDVADVIGIALGCAFTYPADKWVEVDGVKIEGSAAQPECPSIYVTPPMGERRRFLYHYEWSGSTKGAHGLMMRSRADNIALAKRIVDTFGGFVDYNDRDDTDCDYGRPEFADNDACDGDAWRALQRRKADVKPIEQADIDASEAFASYPSPVNARIAKQESK